VIELKSCSNPQDVVILLAWIKKKLESFVFLVFCGIGILGKMFNLRFLILVLKICIILVSCTVFFSEHEDMIGMLWEHITRCKVKLS